MTRRSKPKQARPLGAQRSHLMSEAQRQSSGGDSRTGDMFGDDLSAARIAAYRAGVRVWRAYENAKGRVCRVAEGSPEYERLMKEVVKWLYL